MSLCLLVQERFLSHGIFGLCFQRDRGGSECSPHAGYVFNNFYLKWSSCQKSSGTRIIPDSTRSLKNLGRRWGERNAFHRSGTSYFQSSKPSDQWILYFFWPWATSGNWWKQWTLSQFTLAQNCIYSFRAIKEDPKPIHGQQVTVGDLITVVTSWS